MFRLFLFLFPGGAGSSLGTAVAGQLGAWQGTMPGKAAVTVALQPSGNVSATAAPQKSFPFVLKKIMDIPPPNILEEGDDGKITVPKTSARFPVCLCHVNYPRVCRRF